MSTPSAKYPAPNLSENKEADKSQYYKEIDIANGAKLFQDGRPAVLEQWYDVEAQLFCFAAYYSAVDIDAWSLTDHIAYLVSNGVMVPEGARGHADLSQESVDALIWTVTFYKSMD